MKLFFVLSLFAALLFVDSASANGRAVRVRAPGVRVNVGVHGVGGVFNAGRFAARRFERDFRRDVRFDHFRSRAVFVARSIDYGFRASYSRSFRSSYATAVYAPICQPVEVQREVYRETYVEPPREVYVPPLVEIRREVYRAPACYSAPLAYRSYGYSYSRGRAVSPCH